MQRKWRTTLAAALVLAATATAARAEVLNGIGRFLGVGWSDGYHARNDCEPCHTRWRFATAFHHGGPGRGFPLVSPNEMFAEPAAPSPVYWPAAPLMAPPLNAVPAPASPVPMAAPPHDPRTGVRGWNIREEQSSR
jgi:hypothetical protein